MGNGNIAAVAAAQGFSHFLFPISHYLFFISRCPAPAALDQDDQHQVGGRCRSENGGLHYRCQRQSRQREPAAREHQAVFGEGGSAMAPA
ncbi:hypothetical protein D3C83_35910 [compost metagenome]